MRKIHITVLAVLVAMMLNSVTVLASQSLDDVINENQQASEAVTEPQEQVEQPEETAEEPVSKPSDPVVTESGVTIDYGSGGMQNEAIIENTQGATDLGEPSSGANKINAGIKKIASLVIQVLAYAITALLVVRVLLDLCYVVIPFSRSLLSNGFAGNANAGAGNQQTGAVGGYNTGYNGGGYGYNSGGYNRGYNSYNAGMNGVNQMNNSINANNTRESITGSLQLVSTAALNAVAAENVQGPGGKAISPLKSYMKEMAVVLVLTPILLVLAISGALTNLGFMLGELLANAVSNIGGWV